MMVPSVAVQIAIKSGSEKAKKKTEKEFQKALLKPQCELRASPGLPASQSRVSQPKFCAGSSSHFPIDTCYGKESNQEAEQKNQKNQREGRKRRCTWLFMECV